MFFHFKQNNSGGKFAFDEKRGITHHVVIEGFNVRDAVQRAEKIGLDFGGSGDCPCCGNRWHEPWDEDGDDVPKVYGQEVGADKPYKEEFKGWMPNNKEVAIHYADGSIVWPRYEVKPRSARS